MTTPQLTAQIPLVASLTDITRNYLCFCYVCLCRCRQAWLGCCSPSFPAITLFFSCSVFSSVEIFQFQFVPQFTDRLSPSKRKQQSHLYQLPIRRGDISLYWTSDCSFYFAIIRRWVCLKGEVQGLARYCLLHTTLTHVEPWAMSSPWLLFYFCWWLCSEIPVSPSTSHMSIYPMFCLLLFLWFSDHWSINFLWNTDFFFLLLYFYLLSKFFTYHQQLIPFKSW